MTQLFMVHPGPLTDFSAPALDSGYAIRKAVQADSRALAELLSEAYDDAWSAPRVGRELLDAPDVPVTWVIEDSAGIVAVASERILPDSYPDAGYVHYVAVSRRARGHRLGAAVTAQCLIGFGKRGLPTAVLETDDFRVPAVVTYLRLGFVPEIRPQTASVETKSWSELLPELIGGRA